MKDYAIVSTKQQLKSALEDNISRIIITDAELAAQIKTLKNASLFTMATQSEAKEPLPHLMAQNMRQKLS